MSATTIPLGDAPALRSARNRTRIIRIGLVGVLLGTMAAAFFAARSPSLSPTPLLPPGSSGVIVLDLSISVEDTTLDRMYTSLSQLAATHDRFGLVLFSSRAYEALPPNTPASELKPIASFFHQLPAGSRGGGFGGGGGQFGGGQNQPEGYSRNPWSCCFSFGTEASTGLDLARSIIVANHISDPSVWLISDLADDPGDHAAVMQSARAYERDGIALHVIGLAPKPADRRFFAGLVGPRGSVTEAAPSTRVRLNSKSTFPVALIAWGAVAAVLLAVNEIWGRPLRWGRPVSA